MADRISVRLPPEQVERLRGHRQETGDDLSRVVRQALDAYLGPDPNSAPNATSRPRLAPPEQIGPLMPKYRAWANGDLRKHRNWLFAELLAACFVCKLHYPRTPGMVDGYAGLRQLCRHFGLED